MPLHRFSPRLWPALRLRQGLCSRLPAHCLRALQEDEPPAAPVHWRPQGARYRRNPRTGERERLQDVPVAPFLPPAAHRGLWGGEGWVRGFRYARNDKLSTRLPKVWKPQLFERRLYSEILDATLTVTVTMRTLDLIDQAYGFDFYILKARPRPRAAGTLPAAAAGVKIGAASGSASGNARGASSPFTCALCGVWVHRQGCPHAGRLASSLRCPSVRVHVVSSLSPDPKSRSVLEAGDGFEANDVAAARTERSQTASR
uniref:Large ribosomal subunit protein bL28m n=1 Tax=Anser brachyrhynchus TaxID=132585 RepID=A0A8B9ID40_9AVES